MTTIGIIGTGFGGTVQLPGFVSTAGATVMGIASRSTEKARKLANQYSIPHIFTDWKELVTRIEIDAISIATPPSMHLPIAILALKHRKSVLCEKPMAMNADQAWQMWMAACDAGRVSMVDFEFREIPAFCYLKSLIQNREMGNLRHVNVNWMVSGWADPKRSWSWRSDASQGGGTLGALGVHTLDYIEWFLGPIHALSAHLTTRVTTRPDDKGMQQPVDTDDCCHLILELQDGTPISIQISAIATVGQGHFISFFGDRKALFLRNDDPRDYMKGFEIWEGTLNSTHVSQRKIPRRFLFHGEYSDGRIAPFARIAEKFVQAIQEKRLDVRPNFQDGYRSRLLMDLILQSSRERKWVQIPETKN